MSGGRPSFATRRSPTGCGRRCSSEIEDAQVAVFGATPVDGLGNAGGFKLMIEDRGDNSLQALQDQAENLAEKGNKMPGLVDLFTMFRANTPQQFLAVDRTKCKTHGRGPERRLRHPASLPGRLLRQRFQPVRPHLAGERARPTRRFRMHPQDVKQLKVRNAAGEMVPLGTLVTIRDATGPDVINRYNTYRAAALNGDLLAEDLDDSHSTKLAQIELNAVCGKCHSLAKFAARSTRITK